MRSHNIGFSAEIMEIGISAEIWKIVLNYPC